jgi:hypothetical protein
MTNRSASDHAEATTTLKISAEASDDDPYLHLSADLKAIHSCTWSADAFTCGIQHYTSEAAVELQQVIYPQKGIKTENFSFGDEIEDKGIR